MSRAAVPLVGLLLAVPAAGLRTSAMDPVRAAVAARGEAVGLWSPPATREKRVLAGLLRRLDRPREDALADLRAAAPVAARLLRIFPGDAGLLQPLEEALADLREHLHGEQVAMAHWAGRTGSDRGQRRLERGIRRVNECVAWSDAAPDLAERARHLLRACVAVHRTREAIELPAPRFDPPPFEGVAPEFSLPDVNTSSATFGEIVTPGVYAGKVSAWYFLRTT